LQLTISSEEAIEKISNQGARSLGQDILNAVINIFGTALV